MKSAALVIAGLMSAAFVAAAMAGGPTHRHLACSTVKDSLGGGFAPLGATVPLPGVACVAKLPAKRLCRSTQFLSPDPPPPNLPNSFAPTRVRAFLC